jgi:hypothetical protein
MNKEACDKAVNKILCSAVKKDAKPDALRDFQKKLNKQTESLSMPNRQLIEQAFQISRNFWHEASRPPVSGILSLLDGLCSSEFYETAETLFKVCLTSLASADVTLLKNATPSVTCITLWQKESKIKAESLCTKLSESPDEYYGTVWCDWYVEKATVKSLLTFVRHALRGIRRASRLPDAVGILKRVLERDAKSVLVKDVLSGATQDSVYLARLISACSSVRDAGEAYARELGLILSKGEDAAAVLALKKSVQELAGGIDGRVALYASQFAAHVVTTWCCTKVPAPSKEDSQKFPLLSIGEYLFFLDPHRNGPAFWIAGTTESIGHEVVVKTAKITVSAAMEIAQALRASQTGGNAADALWSAALNLGLQELGAPDDAVVFDPLLHEDIKGGLIRGDATCVVRCGWVFGEDVVVRAQVQAI